ncbi:MAG: tryptophan 7-halogenase, partial [Alphaproteobacteria bacterium]|nr:tryptophan 7-halogenase [Alphaproteobacteria bacterium]
AESKMLGGLVHAFHIDASRYAQFLRAYAEARGVRRIEGRVVDTTRHAESGDVSSVILASGNSVNADLFIDCSGFGGLLIEQALATGYEHWSHWLPCDRALALPCESVTEITPYTRATAHKAGWQWRIPLQNRIGNGHVYSSAHISDDDAANILLANLDGTPLADPRPLRFSTGRRKKFWNHNVVALGLAAGFIEPLESTSIHLVQSGLERLIRFLPRGRIEAADVAAFNAQTIIEWESVRDFLILHYHANTRPEPFWQACATMAVPDMVAEKIALFRANGRIMRRQEELFSENGWLQVMHGQGLSPQGYHPLADIPGDAELDELLTLLRRTIRKTVAAMPPHARYIAAHCRAS